MELVTLLGKDADNIGQINALINRMDCDKIIILKNPSTNFSHPNQKCKTINLNSDLDLFSLKKEIQAKISSELSGDFEVALSIASGSGKEHMALISALLSIPVGIKIVAYTKNGVEFLT
ncbi:hypothetical protein HY450_03300 [Candidatus Pacearchaeota archaeon]|nr:hypothetical protein [Candidatus Pacearchaeota archaeon]